jgi:predicted secreted protein
MVPIRIRDHRRPLPGAFSFYALHRSDFWYGMKHGIQRTVLRYTGPRFALVGLWYILTRRPNSSLPKFIAGVGIFRTLTCGGWTYVTSTDDHDWHDIFMISYLVATLPWTLGCVALSPKNPTALKYRKVLAGSFFGTLVPLIYFFIQHKVHRVAGGTFSHRTVLPLLMSSQHTQSTLSSNGHWSCSM